MREKVSVLAASVLAFAFAFAFALAFVSWSCARATPPPETAAAGERLAAANQIVGSLIGAPAASADARVATFLYDEKKRVDIYWPPGFAFDRRVPLVLFVVSIADSKVKRDIGSSAPDLAAYVSWCAAAACQGAAAAIMTVTEPAKDLEKLAMWLKKQAGALRLDMSKVYLWACSSNWTSSARLVASGGPFEKEVAGISLYYAYVSVITPSPAKDVPVEVVIPEKDNVAEMRTLASYAERLKADGCAVRVIKIPGASHSFDTRLDAPETRATVAGTLEAIRTNLGL